MVSPRPLYRLYREKGLSLRTKYRKKRVIRNRVTSPPATRPNERWSMDCMTDALLSGRRFRVLAAMDNASRVSPAIVADFSLRGEQVVAVLERLKGTRGTPKRLAADNEPEFISKALDAWAYRNGVRREFSRLGKPRDNAFVESFNGHFRAECPDQHWDNAFVESFNGHFRAECPDQHWFASLEEVRQIIEAWRIDDNTERPHRALKQRTPAAFEAEWRAQQQAAD